MSRVEYLVEFYNDSTDKWVPYDTIRQDHELSAARQSVAVLNGNRSGRTYRIVQRTVGDWEPFTDEDTVYEEDEPGDNTEEE